MINSEITILLFACNRPKYVLYALNSISSQTYRNWRLIFSDDSFNDEAAIKHQDLLSDFQRQHPRADVKYIRQRYSSSKNYRSPGQHVASAIPEVKTPFVALHSDDDIWMPFHLERSMQWLQNDCMHGLTVSDAMIIDAEGKQSGGVFSGIKIPIQQSSRWWMEVYLRSFYGNTAGFIARTDVISDFPNIETSIQDVAIAIWVLMKGYKIFGFEQPSYYYRVHENTVTGRSEDRFHRERNLLRIWLAKNYFFKITSRCYLFPLLVLKSVWDLRTAKTVKINKR